ncbi:MAG: type VII toxin-antitoxin system MntA family adenylyltransferase antitoxin [Acidobacteriota bacterium]
MDRLKAPVDALGRFFSEKQPEGIVSVYLFGSHAAGHAHRESDIDVAILFDWKSFPARRVRFERRLRIAAALISVLGTEAVDTVVLNDVPPTLGTKIVTTGRRIFCSNVRLDRAYLRDIQLRRADLIPFLERTRLIKLAVIQR